MHAHFVVAKGNGRGSVEEVDGRRLLDFQAEHAALLHGVVVKGRSFSCRYTGTP